MRAAGKFVVGGVFAAMVAGGGYGGYNIYQSLTGGGTDAVKTGPPSAEEGRETAEEFLTAWSAGKTSQAASLTDNDAVARQALGDYAKIAHVKKVSFKAKSPEGSQVAYAVKATVSYKGQEKSWRYEATLNVVRGVSTGKALVDWKPAVLHPELKQGESLRTGEAESPQVQAVDRNGKELDPKANPSLAPVLDQLRKTYAGRINGEPGIELVIEGAAEAPDKSLLVLTKGKPGRLETTLDAGLQKAAEQAVSKYGEASVVAVKPSTGAVLALANADHAEFNAAFMAQKAPGSTFKIVTATALLATGQVSPQSSVPCQSQLSVGGKPYTNVDSLKEIKNSTFEKNFASSCNTGFVYLHDKISDGALADTANRYFGLGRDNWKTGIPSHDGIVPSGTGDEKTSAMIGQGQVLMSPLDMASVSATVATGQFRQPYIVAASLDDRPFAEATALPAGTRASLQSMMRLTVINGSASRVGLPPGSAAKTGSAEVDGQAKPDSWFTAYHGDVAAAAWVPEGGSGSEAAGPVVKAVLGS